MHVVYRKFYEYSNGEVHLTTDGDGILDGTEIGLTDPQDTGATDVSQGKFIPDEDPLTKTDPINPDTDGDRLLDGEEDVNANGQVDAGESDPNRTQGLPFIPLLLLNE